MIEIFRHVRPAHSQYGSKISGKFLTRQINVKNLTNSVAAFPLKTDLFIWQGSVLFFRESPVFLQLLFAEVAPVAVDVLVEFICLDSGGLFEHEEGSLPEVLRARGCAHEAVVGNKVESYAFVVDGIDAGNELLNVWLKPWGVGRFDDFKILVLEFPFLPFACLLDGDVLFVENMHFGEGAHKEGLVVAVETEHVVAPAV